MTLVFKNRVKETCTAPGTGTVTLLGPVTGFVGFSTIGTTNTTYYTIADQVGNNWEVGLGTWTAGGSYGTLARTTVFSNSLGTTAYINFSSGTQDVFITGPSERYLFGLTTATGSVSNPSTTTLGYNAVGVENNSTAIGRGAQAYFEGVAVGDGAGAKSASPNGGSIAIGRAANASSPNGISIGANAFINTPGNHSIAIGKSASILYPNSIALTASGSGLSIPNSGVFIDSIRDESAGSPDKTLKYNSTTKELFYGASGGGSSPATPTTFGTVYGATGNATSSVNNTLYGFSGVLGASVTDATIIGAGANVSGTSGLAGSVAVGARAKALVGDSVSIGADSQALYYGSLAVGTTALTSANYSIAIGTEAHTNTTAQGSVVIGYNSFASNGTSIAIGQGAGASYDSSVVVGANAGDTAANAVVVGYGSVAGNGSITIGANTFNNQANSIALSTSGTLSPANSGVFIDSMRDESAGSPDKTLKYNTTTKEIFYGTGGGGSGTVTDVSVVAANGFNGTVATSTTTPAITLTTTVTGVLKGNGTAISAAAAGTDYAPATTGTSAQLLANNGTGGFDNVTVGSGLSLSAGTLSAITAAPFPYVNPSTISQNITVTTGNNAMLVGPITVANGYSITVDSGANFVVVT